MLYFFKINFDYLKFEGNDRLDLINRLSTNEVKSLEKFKGVKTILTSDKGRIIDVITLFNFADFVFATCSARNSKAVLSHLEKYTIMDDFLATDMSGTHEAVLFFGKDAFEFSNRAFFIDPARFENNDFNIYVEDDRHAIVARNDDAFGGILFIYAAEDKEFWNEKIFSDELCARFSFSEVSELEFNSKRIEKGIPGFPNELNDSVNPLECGMEKYVSFTKGCYIGQEVIARLDAYDKISRHLVGFAAGEEIPAGTRENEQPVFVSGKKCGYITSSAFAEKHGYIALGFVKTIFIDPDKKYSVSAGTREIECRFTKLPF